MIFKKFKSNYVPDIVALLKKSCRNDFISEELIKEKIFEDLDFDSELTLTAFEGDKLVGFIMGVIRKTEKGDVGYVKLLAVEEKFRRKKIGKGLLNIVEEKLKERNVNILRAFDSHPNYLSPGVDPFYTETVYFLESVGFKKIGDCVSLECNLFNQSFESRDEEIELFKQGVFIVRAKMEEFDSIKNWAEKYFPSKIQEISSAFLNKPISLHLAKNGNELLGFSSYKTNNKELGWLGALEVTGGQANSKIAEALLKTTLRDLQQSGFLRTIVPCANDISFYARTVNARISRIFWRYEKLL